MCSSLRLGLHWTPLNSSFPLIYRLLIDFRALFITLSFEDLTRHVPTLCLKYSSCNGRRKTKQTQDFAQREIMRQNTVPVCAPSLENLEHARAVPELHPGLGTPTLIFGMESFKNTLGDA